MFCEYFNLTGDIINNVSETTKGFNVKDIIEVLTNLLIAFAGVYGIKYLNKLKEKNNNAVFGFYVRLNVRLHCLNTIFEDYKEEILDRFIPEGDRKEIDPSKVALVKRAIDKLVQNSKETLEFLKNAEEQMPASPNWYQCYGILLELLEDCEKLEYDKYFKWNNDYSDNKTNYYTKHKNNIELMLKDIATLQVSLQKKLYKDSLIIKLKKKFPKKKNR